MRSLAFNDGWKYRHLNTDEEWKNVTLPHDAMILEPRSFESSSGTHGAWFLGFDYEYTKDFVVDKE